MVFFLTSNWFLQSTAKIQALGPQISSPGYDTLSWYATEVPSTVVQALAQNKVIPDPNYSLNMKKLPGFKHDSSDQMANIAKPIDSPYRDSWWYRTEFVLSEEFQHGDIWLDIEGINFSANIWLNGKRIGARNYIIGTYRTYSINVSNFVLRDEKNIIAFEIFSAQPDELAMTFIDWCPTPPDDNMGIWHPVSLRKSGPVSIVSSFIDPKLNTVTLQEADIYLEITLKNSRSHPESISVHAKIGEIDVNLDTSLSAWETKILRFNPDTHPQLTVSNPRIWWPYELGTPELYECQIILTCTGSEEIFTETRSISFGIREVIAEINKEGARQFEINGVPLFLRAAAWTPGMYLNTTITQDEIDLSFIKNLNLNCLRFEGKFASSHFWNRCDEEGILIIAGWPCCNHWEKWDLWKPGDLTIAAESLRSQLVRFRNHPSFAAWFYGSDAPPPGWVEKVYLEILDEVCPFIPRISSASAEESEIQGESGVKMSGPYSYVPPDYWYHPNRPGWADSFNTETGPDTCFPPIDSLSKFLTAEELFVGSDGWKFHCGLDPFNHTKLVEKSVKKRYGDVNSLSEFVQLCQIAGYDGWRAMYEAYARNFPRSTGIVGWMLNSPWPSLIWQLYDVYNNPNGAYFGVKKACESVHIQYSYDDHSIWGINRSIVEYKHCDLEIIIFDGRLQESNILTLHCDLPPYSRLKIGQAPNPEKFSDLYFLSLKLKDRDKIVARNLYWLTPHLPEYAGKDTFYHTVLKKAGNMHSLTDVPKCARNDILCEIERGQNSDGLNITIQIENTSPYLALFLRLDLFDLATSTLISPVIWSENCISLLRNDRIVLQADVPVHLKENPMKLRIVGYNVEEELFFNF